MRWDQCLRFRDSAQREAAIRNAAAFDPREFTLSDFLQEVDRARGEPDMQHLFEGHPELLPGLLDRHNGAHFNVVVRKLPLGADHVPDFFFISRNSAELQYTFVEIENPRKRIFGGKDAFTGPFHRALQQVKDWGVWYEKRGGNLALEAMTAPLFRTFPREGDYRSIVCYLVIGRRCEVEKTQLRRDRWGKEVDDARQVGCHLMTYDRLVEFIRFAQYSEKLAVTAYRQKDFWYLR